jgi:hemolysin activation/secretion protein
MTLFRITLIVAFSIALPALAQQAPDAGQMLQQQAPAMQAPKTGATIDVQTPVTTPTTPGGAQVTVQAVSINGNSVFSEKELLVVLGDVAGKAYDLAGLRGLAERISNHYRDAGYPFARAYLPQQAAADGKLRVEVVEGRYGKVQTLGDKELAAGASDFLSPLKPSAVINSETLERATLILDDQPGIKVAPIIRPGQEVGTGDLDVRIEREPRFSGDVGFDNHGNRYTGEHRLRANLQWDSPFTFGDQITVRSLLSDEGMWLGSLGYSLPLGGSGLRGNVGYSHMSYELGKDFANLQSTGTAKATSLGVSYPIIRSQRANLTVAASYQYKKLNDKQGLASTNENKSSDSLPVTLQFDQRDGFGGGGIAYGNLAYTPGRLKLDTTLTTTDQTSGQNTRGRFDKWNLDIARVQALPAGFTGFGRISAQWAGKNLDSSEGFSLGGANGVRGYPSGEGNGDEGWMAQLELRYAMGAFNPYVFHDSGRVKINADTGSLAVAPNTNHRSIGSFGVGTRYTEGNINLDASLAWRTHGGQPQSDTADRDTRAWVTVGYKF